MFKSFIVVGCCLLGCLNLYAGESSSEVMEEKTSTQSFAVGELGAAWQFPSDHLPVGATVGNIHLVSWNILETRYLHYIIGNGQGLRDSLILSANVPIAGGRALTVRERLLVDAVLKMVRHPEVPRGLIALEETGKHVFQELKKELPSHMVMVAQPEEFNQEDLFIYDNTIFDFVSFQAEHYVVEPKSTFLTLTLVEKSSGRSYRFIQSHVPGGPIKSAPARKELAAALMESFDPEMITVLMGDMNRSSDYFIVDFEKAAREKGLERQPFVNLPIPYPTHIDTAREATWIDNLFIALSEADLPYRVTSEGSEFFEEMGPVLELLQRIQI